MVQPIALLLPEESVTVGPEPYSSESGVRNDSRLSRGSFYLAD